MTRRNALTALRGLAAWWVVLFHFQLALPSPVSSSASEALAFSRFVAKGYLAVDLFFVLSGFIISLNYAERLGRLNLRTYSVFLWARFARIYPLHIVMLAFYLTIPPAIMLFSHAKIVGREFDIWYFVLSVLLVQNWGIVDHLAWNVPAWSISTEMAAYLVFPLGAWALRRVLSTVVRAVFSACCLAFILAMIFSLQHASLGGMIPTLGLPRCLLEFGLGACTYKVWALRGGDGLASAVVCLTGSVVLMGVYMTVSIPDYAIMPASFALLIYALACNAPTLLRIFEAKPLVALGEISFSTYLAHYFIKIWIKFLIPPTAVASGTGLCAYVGATFLASVALYTFVEVPGRKKLRGLEAMRDLNFLRREGASAR